MHLLPQLVGLSVMGTDHLIMFFVVIIMIVRHIGNMHQTFYGIRKLYIDSPLRDTRNNSFKLLYLLQLQRLSLCLIRTAL